MASYAALTLHFNRRLSASAILAPSFQSELFHPVATGAVAMAPDGDQWFLAGYAVEDSLALLRGGRGGSAASVEVHANAERDELEYLNERASAVMAGELASGLLSPFEVCDDALGVTRVDARQLDPAILSELDAWMLLHPGAHLTLYGSVELAVAHAPNVTRVQAFRVVNPPAQRQFTFGVPILVLRVQPSLNGNSLLSLRSGVPVWCVNAGALNGRLEPLAAEENLKCLADLGCALARTSEELPTVELHLEGSVFSREEARFRRFFADIL